MFGLLKKKQKNNRPGVPKSQPYQLRNDVNQQHLHNWNVYHSAGEVGNKNCNSDNSYDSTSHFDSGSSGGSDF